MEDKCKFLGAMEKVGDCMDKYWQMKKTMAPGCEPEFVSRIMSAVRPHALGMCMAGAGGGGFMYVLARDHESQKNIRNLIDSMEVCTRFLKVPYNFCCHFFLFRHLVLNLTLN
jgi:galactokinase/mevalonate kinase-like predicted kinase